jgi:hypothetical protein
MTEYEFDSRVSQLIWDTVIAGHFIETDAFDVEWIRKLLRPKRRK